MQYLEEKQLHDTNYLHVCFEFHLLMAALCFAAAYGEFLWAWKWFVWLTLVMCMLTLMDVSCFSPESFARHNRILCVPWTCWILISTCVSVGEYSFAILWIVMYFALRMRHVIGVYKQNRRLRLNYQP